MTETWCSLAWNHHFIGPGGRCKPCCRFKRQNVSKKHHLNYDDLQTLFHNEFMTEIRELMLRGEKVSGCEKCYEEEAAFKRASLRQIYNRPNLLSESIDIKNPKITFLEVAFSNICDLKCVMCHPFFSTEWGKEDLTNIRDLNYQTYGYITVDVEKLKPVIPQLLHLKLTGGEPLLIKEYHDILEELGHNDNLSSVYLNYSSNLMHFPKQWMLDIWKKVQFVEIAASFDGVEDVIEYVRYPSEWNKIKNNIQKYMKLSNEMDLRIGMRSTIMVYNVLNLPQMVSWWVENLNKYFREPFSETSWINPTHVALPEFLSLRVLPQKAKDIVRKRLQNKGINNKVNQCFNHLCNYMDNTDYSFYLDHFRRFTKEMDKRGKTFQEICPELYNEIF